MELGQLRALQNTDIKAPLGVCTPDDAARRRYDERREALCCLECGFGWAFEPTVQGSIGRPLSCSRNIFVRKMVTEQLVILCN